MDDKTYIGSGADGALWKKLINLFHESPVGGHSGIRAAYNRIPTYFRCSGLKKDVKVHVLQCNTCQRSKGQHQYPSGPLQPIPIQQRAWHTIYLAFIEGLPQSQRYKTILVVVDRFTKVAHFIPLTHPILPLQ
jgi:hypothetical protein